MEYVKEEIVSDNSISTMQALLERKYEVSTSKMQANEIDGCSLKSEIPNMKYDIGDNDIYIKVESMLTEELHIKIEDAGDATYEAFNGFPHGLHLECVICDSLGLNRNHLQRLINCSVEKRFNPSIREELHLRNKDNGNATDEAFPQSQHLESLICDSTSSYLKRLQRLINRSVEKQVESVISKKLDIKNVGDTRASSVKKLFKCNVCDFKSDAKSNLQLHILTHSGESPFKCGICNYICNNKRSLCKHIDSHTVKKPFECVCGYKCSRKIDLILHIRIHAGENREMVEQEESDDDIPLVLLKHKLHTIQMQIVSSQNTCKSPCLDKLEPEVGISQSLELKSEIVDRDCNVKRVENICKNQELLEICKKPCDEDIYNCGNELRKHIKIPSRAKSFRCNICDSCFKHKYQLKVHLRIHTGEKPFKCKICGSSFMHKSNLGRHLNIHKGKKPFKCNICYNSYKEKSALKVHLRTHTGEKPFLCNFCHYSSGIKQHLQLHLITHSGEKSFKCNVCDYRCGRNTSLQRHLKIHTGEKPFKCNICNYSFGRKDKLKRHLGTHTGEKPFKCNICSYRCDEKDRMYRHLKTHTGEKPFKCNICDCSYARKSQLQSHLITHTGDKPFKCNICNYCCGQKSYLKIHLRTHTGEKPFKCNICNYCYGHKSTLKTHLRTHTGEKPYKCNICDYSCGHRGILKTHLTTHTGDKPEKILNL